MSDTALKNAATRIDQLQVEISKLSELLAEKKREFERVSSFIRQWEEFAGTPSGLSELFPATAKVPSGPITPKPKNPRKEAVAEMAREIIIDHQRPMMRTELFDELAKRGMIIHGSNPEMVLSTMLWRQPSRIVRLPKGGYWLPELPHEESGYYPAPPF